MCRLVCCFEFGGAGIDLKTSWSLSYIIVDSDIDRYSSCAVANTGTRLRATGDDRWNQSVLVIGYFLLLLLYCFRLHQCLLAVVPNHALSCQTPPNSHTRHSVSCDQTELAKLRCSLTGLRKSKRLTAVLPPSSSLKSRFHSSFASAIPRADIRAQPACTSSALNFSRSHATDAARRSASRLNAGRKRSSECHAGVVCLMTCPVPAPRPPPLDNRSRPCVAASRAQWLSPASWPWGDSEPGSSAMSVYGSSASQMVSASGCSCSCSCSVGLAATTLSATHPAQCVHTRRITRHTRHSQPRLRVSLQVLGQVATFRSHHLPSACIEAASAKRSFEARRSTPVATPSNIPMRPISLCSRFSIVATSASVAAAQLLAVRVASPSACATAGTRVPAAAEP